MKRFIAPLSLLAAGVALGLLSAQYLMENANVAVPVSNSKWSEIQLSSESLQSSYLSGHFLRRGQVPPLKGSRFFVRNSDDDGNSLRGDCVVSLEGRIPAARWWFVSASSGKGRTTLDAAQAIRESNGEVAVSISQSPVAGNWIIPKDGSSYDLHLVLLGVDDAAVVDLPRVKRLWC
jgi:hypothetical protein